jgi:hypothetical protein
MYLFPLPHITDLCVRGRAFVCVPRQVNGRELLALAGAPTPQGSDNADACDFRAVAAAAAALAASLGGPAALACVCWTDGPFPGGAWDVRSGRAWRLEVPQLPAPVRSPVGAGDAVAGDLFHAWLALTAAAAAAAAAADATAGADPSSGPSAATAGVPSAVAAFAFGLACGAASCLTAENSRFDLATALAIHAQIRVEEANV